MKAITINAIKEELKNLSSAELKELCLRLAKYKKENKELLYFILFESTDLENYIISVKELISKGFEEMNKSNMYFAKKSIRKILRLANKYIKYSASKHAEIELLIFFCVILKESGIALAKSSALQNLYKNQVKKIHASIFTLHEDLQYDYLKSLEKLS